MTPLERFEKKISPEPMSGCWLWTACVKKTTSPNYEQPRCTLNGKTECGARASWKLYKGKIPPGMHVLHTCHNCYCVNPNHLYLGTHQDNMLDMVKEGRGASACQKMCKEDILEARKLRAEGCKVVSLAKKYGVSAKALSRAIVGKIRWAKLES